VRVGGAKQLLAVHAVGDAAHTLATQVRPA
jgi:hypothetical protein